MKDIKDIKQDLKDIRYFYSRKSFFESESPLEIGQNEVIKKASKYNEIIKLAPPRLYDLYVSLYVQNCTQETISIKWGYTLEHICRLNAKLVKYLFENLNKEVNENV